jgi:N utilization substance protein A
MKLFEVEVPEIREGIIEIKLCAREPGARSKIAVLSHDRDIDPVGACVGMKGSRVQNVIQELKGEKIDIIPYSENPVVFVQSALAPAEISSIRFDERGKSMEIMVEDDQLSLAIGRKGQNVRLASQLTGWKLDILSKSKLAKRRTDALMSLQQMPGVTETLAEALYQSGFFSTRAVSEAPAEALQKVPGYESEEAAKALRETAVTAIKNGADPIQIATPAASRAAAPAGESTAKAQAERRMREMVKQADSATVEAEAQAKATQAGEMKE